MKPDKNSELIVCGIGICAAVPEDKKVPLVFCAYARSQNEPNVGFVAIEFPVKKLLEREDILSAIAYAENVKCVSYVSNENENETCLKDIFVCREQEGKVIDVVERTSRNEFIDGFAEIAAGSVKFGVAGSLPKIKPYTVLSLEIDSSCAQKYKKAEYEYAIVNAYNACLLGRLISSAPDLDFVTKDKKRVRVEVRLNGSAADGRRLYITPDTPDSEGYVCTYKTEQFKFIAKDENSGDVKELLRQYKIIYKNNLNNYYLSRV